MISLQCGRSRMFAFATVFCFMLVATLASVTDAAGPRNTSETAETTSFSCTGVFPAMAYAKIVRDRKGKPIGNDLFVADSTGSCSVKIYSSKFLGLNVSYRQVGSEGRIVWSQSSDDNASRANIGKPVVKLLKFNVSNGAITNSLPLTATTAYMHPNKGGMIDVELSKSGNTAYFVVEQLNANNKFQDFLFTVDITSCVTGCTTQSIYSFTEDIGVAQLSINDAEDRLFMAIHDRMPDIRTVSFLTKQAGTWSSIRHVVSNQDDAAYSGSRGFIAVSYGEINGGILAFGHDPASGSSQIDIVDTSSCASVGTQSCLSTSESSVLAQGIVGVNPKFTSTPSSGSGPDLLFNGSGAIIVDYNLNANTSTSLGTGFNADPAD